MKESDDIQNVQPHLLVEEGTQLALLKREDLYRKLIEEIDEYAIILLNTKGIILNWNRGAQKIHQYSKEEALGKHFSMFYLPEDHDAKVPHRLLSTAAEEGRAIHEGWRNRKDGTSFWASVTITALHNDKNEVIGFSKLTRDLTRKKIADDQLQEYTVELQHRNEMLRESEERYHKMVDEVQDYAIIFLDRDGKIRNWNKGAQKIKQYEESEVIGKHFSLFYLREDRVGKLPEILLQQAATYGRAIHEGWRLRKDRTKFWGSITLTALHDENNEIIGFSKVTRDLTEKKLIEDRLHSFTAELQKRNEELRKSEERYHRMIAEVEDYAIILLDLEGNVMNWNAGAEKIKGYKYSEIVGKNFSIFYAPEDQARGLPMQLLGRAYKDGRAVHEGWRIAKDGSKFWGSIVITALHDEEGAVIGYSKVTRDLTEKKLADDTLKEYLVELQRQNEELDQFAYAASHDLQEPLRKILTFADMIEQHRGDENATNKYLAKISSSARRMSELIKSILDYSRLTKAASEKKDTDLQLILDEVLMDFDLLIQQKNAVVWSDNLPFIRGFPMQINQLFSNLIGNALKFTGNQKPEIRITAATVHSTDISSVSADLPEGRYLQIKFSDNGIGFEPQYAQLIFSLFQRLHGKNEYGGTGIGLALSKKIMDNHGGAITAEGRPGHGASFYLYFPL